MHFIQQQLIISGDVGLFQPKIVTDSDFFGPYTRACFMRNVGLFQVKKTELKIRTMKVGDVDHWQVFLFSKWHLALIHQHLVYGETAIVEVDLFSCFPESDYNL